MPVSIYLEPFHGFVAIGDFILTASQVLLQTIHIKLLRKIHIIKGLRFRYLNEFHNNHYKPLLQRIPFYEDLTTYLDDTAIQEVVLTNKTVSILSTEIIDIAFVFKADEVKPFLSDCCRRVNVFIVYF